MDQATENITVTPDIVKEKEVKEHKYNEAKMWQIAAFASNNTATNMYNFLIGFVAYYATGIAGLAVVVVTTLMTSMRIFDGITDPIIGFLIDKTDGKFGKFRPFIILGNLILATSILLMFWTTHLVPESFRLVYFILIYAIYIIGYTCQTASTKSGQAVITNHPKQRPMFSLFDGIYTLVFYSLAGLYVSNYLTAKHGGFTMSLFREFTLTIIIGSAILTLISLVGIWKKDVKENFGLGDKGQQVKFKDYWPILKENRALQMLIVAASTDKIASNIRSNAATGVIIFGIIMGNYALMGQMGIIGMIPGVIFTFIGTAYARNHGQKETLVRSTFISLAAYIGIVLLFFFGDPGAISLTDWNINTILFVGLFVLAGTQSVSGALVITMISDTADYETYRTGRFVPGMMGTAFSFVDKMISSLSHTIVGVTVAMVGFTEAMPEITETLTTGLFLVGIFLYFGMPILGWIASLIAMKFYPLDAEMMETIQEKISHIKEEKEVKA